MAEQRAAADRGDDVPTEEANSDGSGDEGDDKPALVGSDDADKVVDMIPLGRNGEGPYVLMADHDLRR